MALSKEYKQLFRQLNNALDEWEFIGVKPNEVRQAEHMLEMFYEWSGKKPKHTDRFSTRLKLTDDQQEELEQIAQSFVNMEIFASEYYDESFIDKFETARKKGYFKNIEEYKDFIDRKNRFLDQKMIASVIGWYEYDKLLQRYRRKDPNFSEGELNAKIREVYMDTGYEGEELYEFIYKHI